MTIRTTTKREMQIQSKLMFLSQIFEERQFTGDVKGHKFCKIAIDSI